ncbi:hypothetical protein HYH03_015562 [Edaphochlamys debaryana]|uniref:Phospholipid scramblase n=1 Tax=Edaphochlamys debaryana TaxID=47281 RepID=A0A835XMZ8_9CHLO|nr:hypothetical protein HYH03_015562 [Edaphochlamys debaryana]|eukprot:KAG2485753.1 hypothetical protein HYH03_015562 [Edaphochlamys debaryana]
MDKAPLVQTIEEPQLDGIQGVVIKESTQVIDAVMEALGGPFEAANKYKVYPIQGEKRLATNHDETESSWLPKQADLDAVQPVFTAVEKSSTCLRMTLALCGGLNLRALKLNFVDPTNRVPYTVDRPCKMGAGCCCPLEMTMYDANGGMVGQVVEKTEGCFWEQCCLCTYTHKVLVGNTRQSLVHKYNIINPMCCCGRVSNCWGATCCKQNFFIDITDPQGKIVSYAHKTYGGDGGCGACCRMAYDFSNYVLPFPKDATNLDRMLLVLGMLSIEYAYHSRKGGDDD